jgi:hypothetical protein
MRGLRVVRRLVVFGAVAAALGACAKIEPPPGGPEDTTPPYIVGVSPPDSAVEVDRHASVRIDFSERMNRESVERALFVSPYPEPYPRLDWSRGDRRLTLRLDQAFDSNCTYIVTIGSDARDAHSVRIASSYTFAFATGAAISSGRIVGSVYDASFKPAVGTLVGLYATAGSTGPDPARDYPLYTTQAGNDGGFAFGYLASGTYRVLAWKDRQADELLGPDEDAAAPAWDVTLEEGATARLPAMCLAPRDISPPELVLVRATDRNHVAFQFNEEVRAESVTIAIAAPHALGTTLIGGLKPSRAVTVRTPDMTPAASYRLALRAADLAGNAAEWAPDTTLFDAVAAPDTAGPRLVAVEAPDLLLADTLSTVTLWFDDVLDSAAADSVSALRDGMHVPGEWRLDPPNRLVFRPGEAISPGRTVWRVPLTGVRDASGNRSADTATVTLTRAHPDSLGELVGVVLDSSSARQPEGGQIVVEARPLRGEWRLRTVAGVGERHDGADWSLANLPAGAYTLFAWHDRDGDGAWSPGKPFPFVPSERWAVSDTVQIRARWTTTGVRVVFR